MTNSAMSRSSFPSRTAQRELSRKVQRTVPGCEHYTANQVTMHFATLKRRTGPTQPRNRECKFTVEGLRRKRGTLAVKKLEVALKRYNLNPSPAIAKIWADTLGKGMTPEEVLQMADFIRADEHSDPGAAISRNTLSKAGRPLCSKVHLPTPEPSVSPQLRPARIPQPQPSFSAALRPILAQKETRIDESNGTFNAVPRNSYVSGLRPPRWRTVNATYITSTAPIRWPHRAHANHTYLLSTQQGGLMHETWSEGRTLTPIPMVNAALTRFA
ncbi:hypothetical protein C8Q74DRAFT_1233075 [Fomes fomentarius]|nr:hypothetical protein C8Q74DRAFT_1233075 [Fomes fomentarius]